MARFAVAVALVVLGGLLGVPCSGAYLTGVYWFTGDFYQTDITCWNLPGGEGALPVWEFKMGPSGIAAWAPEGWSVDVNEDMIRWLTGFEEYRIPPGEWLSGFEFATDYDPGEVAFRYHIQGGDDGDSWGYFTPELIPEPWLAGPLFLVGVATWETLRRRLRK